MRLDAFGGRLYLRAMALLPIIIAPDRRLKVRSKPVKAVDAGVRMLMDDMLETMRLAPGVGLSAIQVGVAQRVVVARAPETGTGVDTADEPRTLCLANPEITWSSEELVVLEEGCLSLPEQYAELERPAEVAVRFLDHEGKQQEVKTSGLLARCVQHELDHLDGVLLVDRLSAVRRNMILRKLAKAKKLKQPDAA